jgi:hypothetical protein
LPDHAPRSQVHLRLALDPPDIAGAAAMALRMVELMSDEADDGPAGDGDDADGGGGGLIRVELADACAAKVTARAADALRALARDARTGRLGVPATAWRSALREAAGVVRTAASLGAVPAEACAAVAEMGLEGQRADAEVWLEWARVADAGAGGARLEARRVVAAVEEALREAVRALRALAANSGRRAHGRAGLCSRARACERVAARVGAGPAGRGYLSVTKGRSR